MSERPATIRPMDRLILALVRAWCFVRNVNSIRLHRRVFLRWPNPELPRTYQDKMMWRRFFDHNPAWIDLADKLKASHIARARVPELKAAQVLWEGTDPEAIPAPVLAGDVIIKMNAGSGRNIFVRNGQLDRPEMIRKVKRWLRVPYGTSEAQWVYAAIKQKLFVEKLILKDGMPADRQYNVYVSGGKIAYTYFMVGQVHQRHTIAVLDSEGNAHEVADAKYGRSALLPRPENWDHIAQCALKLAEGLDFVRCDFVERDGELWFSEFTLYPRAGRVWLSDATLTDKVNRNWDITKSWFLTTPQKGWKAIYAAALMRSLALTQPAPPEMSMPAGFDIDQFKGPHGHDR